MTKYIKSKKSIPLVMALLLVVMQTPVQAAESTQVNRIYGQDRYQTAYQVASNITEPKNIILAVGYNFPDAISASTLAAKLNAPILLLDETPEESDTTLKQVQSIVNNNGSVYLIGGTAVIGNNFVETLNNMGIPNNRIIRLGGLDRYETSALVATDENMPVNTPVFITTGDDFFDALITSNIAAIKTNPLLLVAKDELPDSVSKYLLTDKPSEITIVSSNDSINKDVIQDIQNITGVQPKVISSEDKYTTEAQVLNCFEPNPTVVYLATGHDYADALTGSVLAAQNKGTLIITDPLSDINKDLKEYLAGQNVPLTVIGGSVAMPNSIVSTVKDILDNVSARPTIAITPSINTATIAGIKPALPSTVQVTMSDHTTRDLYVTWQTIPTNSYTSPGNITITGTINGYNEKVTANVLIGPNTYLTVSSVTTPQVSTIAGTAPILPTTVQATMSNGTIESLPVTWQAIDVKSYAAASTFTVTGVVNGFKIATTDANADTTVKATLTVVVNQLGTAVATRVDPIQLSTIVGAIPTLPTTVTVVMSDGSKSDMNVTWKTISPSSCAEPGTFNINGTINGTQVIVIGTVKVYSDSIPSSLTITSVTPVKVSTTMGTAPLLPIIADAVMSDGTTQHLPVVWQTISSTSYANQGNFSITGTITGYSTTATATITVSLSNAAIISAMSVNMSTNVGVVPSLPDTVLAFLVDGTVQLVPVTWGTIDPKSYKDTGIFTVMGIVDGTSKTVTATVRVITPEPTVTRVEQVNVTTTVGVAPILPNRIETIMSDNTKSSRNVNWDTITTGSYANKGTFQVKGSVNDYGTIYATVTVNDK